MEPELVLAHLDSAIQRIREGSDGYFQYWNGSEWINVELLFCRDRIIVLDSHSHLPLEGANRVSYSETTIRDLYRHTVNNMVLDEGGDLLLRAAAWVTAENFFEIRKIISKWFTMLQDGTANNQYPDPFNNKITQEKADWMIAEIDDDIGKESNRFPEKGKGPDYFRLKAHSRLAMAQEIYGAFKGKKEIIEEAKKRLEKGEKIPPEGVTTTIYYDGGM